MRQFISVNDVDSIDTLIDKAMLYKGNPGLDQHPGKGKRIGCLFFNASMRTRISTQIAAQNLGLECFMLNVGAEGWAMEFGEDVIMDGHKVEHVKDAARVFGRYFDLLAIRTFPDLSNREEDYSEIVMNEFIKYSGLPVISLESATLHPLQSLADLMTMSEHFDFKRKPKIVLTWAPHVKALPQCVANSFAQWMNAWHRADFVITHPQGYELKPEFTEGAQIIYDQREALKDADFVYVKNWSSYNDYGKLIIPEENWMLDELSLKHSNQAKIMHCLPVRRGVEISTSLLDGSESLATEQAGNRVWAAQAVLSEILKSI